MTHRELIVGYLQQIAPRGATNKEIGQGVGIRWVGTVYKTTRRLALDGTIQRVRAGHRWVFSTPQAPAGPTVGAFDANAVSPVKEPPEADAMPDTEETSPPSRARALLEALLNRPDGRAWFLERLRCPCASEEARAAGVTMRSRPLRQLLQADYAACGGVAAAQGRLAQTYNDCFRLSEECGIRKVWRADRPGEMRLPLPKREGGWTPKLLRKHIASKRYLKRALAAPTLVQTRADALLMTSSYVVLVRCTDGDAITKRQHARLQALGGALERRLHRQFFLAAVVDEPDQLAVLEMAHVCWTEIGAWLEQHATAQA